MGGTWCRHCSTTAGDSLFRPIVLPCTPKHSALLHKGSEVYLCRVVMMQAGLCSLLGLL